MSAFIVSERTMHRTVHALMPPDAPCAACDEMGQQLYRLNAEAVLQRYGRPEDVRRYRYAVVFSPLIQQLKSLNCLIYQCSEGTVPQTTLYQSLWRPTFFIRRGERVGFRATALVTNSLPSANVNRGTMAAREACLLRNTSGGGP
jgi:hypothetical protein